MLPCLTGPRGQNSPAYHILRLLLMTDVKRTTERQEGKNLLCAWSRGPSCLNGNLPGHHLTAELRCFQGDDRQHGGKHREDRCVPLPVAVVAFPICPNRPQDHLLYGINSMPGNLLSCPLLKALHGS